MNRLPLRFMAPVLALLLVLAAPAAAASVKLSSVPNAAGPEAPPTRPADPGMLVSADWVAAHAGDPDVVILHADMRRDSYDQGHIPGARFLDMTGLVWDGDPPVGAEMRTPVEIQAAFEAVGVSDGQRIVVYGVNPLMAARAWMTLDVMGLGDHASMLDGGMGGWQEDGRPVSTEVPPERSGSLTLHPRSGVVVDSDWILHRLDDPSLTLLDARVADQYSGMDQGGGGRLHHGHIPGAYSLPWEEFVDHRPNPVLDSRVRLAELVAASGAADGSTVVAYCVTGMRASFEYFVARLLGYDVKLYDGSWRDWGSKDLPTVTGTSRR